MSFGQRLHQLRIARRMSLQQVADAVDLSKAHVWNLEKGLSENPSIDVVTRLADLFRVRIADLVGENPAAGDEPPEMVAMFNREIREILLTDEVKKAFQAQGMDPSGSTPAEFKHLVEKDAQRWSQLIKSQKISAE